MIYLNICAPGEEISDTERNEIFSFFGESQREYIEGKRNEAARMSSLGGLLSLMRIAKEKMNAASLEILREEGKKPRLACGGPDFNISHSRSLSICAMCDSSEKFVGADIEFIDESRRTHLIAERFFTDRERELLSDASSSTERFFLLWSAKEARAKMRGEGLSAILADPQRTVGESVRSYFVEYKGEGYVMCVATPQDEDCELACANENIKFIRL